MKTFAHAALSALLLATPLAASAQDNRDQDRYRNDQQQYQNDQDRYRQDQDRYRGEQDRDRSNRDEYRNQRDGYRVQFDRQRYERERDYRDRWDRQYGWTGGWDADRYSRDRDYRDRWDHAHYSGTHAQNGYDRDRYYEKYNNQTAEYRGSYYYRNGRYYPGRGDFYRASDGRYYRYPTTAQGNGYYGPDGRRYNDYNECRRGSNLGGTLAGAGVGALLGNILAGKRDEPAGTLLGGAIGGIAGNQISASGNKRRCY